MKLTIIAILMLSAFVLVTTSCAEDGEKGSATVDCGGHGASHDGHCHCDPGYLFAEETCLEPEAITTLCEEHEHHHEDAVGESGEEVAAEGEEHEEHHHEACLCASPSDCHCEEGTIETFGSKAYCVPNLHAD